MGREPVRKGGGKRPGREEISPARDRRRGGSFCLSHLCGRSRVFWRKLAILGWGLLPLTLLEGVTELFHAQGWRHCLSGSHRSLRFFRVFWIRLAGSSINHLTPTAGFGGEVTKGVLLASPRMGAQAAASVIVDKLSMALAQLLFVVGGASVVLWKIALPRGLWVALTGTLLLLIGVVGFFVVQKYGKLGALVRWAVAHRIGGAALKNAAHHMTQVDQALRFFTGAVLPVSPSRLPGTSWRWSGAFRRPIVF